MLWVADDARLAELHLNSWCIHMHVMIEKRCRWFGVHEHWENKRGTKLRLRCPCQARRLELLSSAGQRQKETGNLPKYDGMLNRVIASSALQLADTMGQTGCEQGFNAWTGVDWCHVQGKI